MIVRRTLVVLLLTALAADAAAQTLPGDKPPVELALSLTEAVDRAMASNPTILAARARRAIDEAGRGVAAERPNPEGRFELERETPKQSFSLALPVELGGKRTRRIAVADATLQVGDAELAQTIFQTRNDVRRAYVDRQVAQARVGFFDEIRTLAERTRNAAQQRVDAGDAPRLEVVQADLALAQADNESTAARGTAEGARIRLNGLLALPLTAAPSLTTPLDVAVVAPAAAIARAQQANAEVAVINRRMDEQRAKIALARALQRPDLTPEVAVTHDSEPDFMYGWRAAIGVGLPLFTRHRAGVLVEEATLSQLTLERSGLLARIAAEVGSAAAVAEAQRGAYVRYRDQIIPQALEVERMAQDSYTLGQTGISALLQALQATRDVRLRSLQTLADFQAALTDLERAAGSPLP